MKAGAKVAVLFINKACLQPHNLIILKPGTDIAYAASADKMILADPVKAPRQTLPARRRGQPCVGHRRHQQTHHYGQSEVLSFTAPADPGDYPYLCTYPGHRFLMKGVMEVTK